MNYQLFLDRYGKTLLIGMASLLGVSIVVWWLFFYEQRLTVEPTPASATVTIDGQSVTGQQQVKLKPGSHTLKVSLNDYIPLEQTIQAASGSYTTAKVTLRALPHLQVATNDSTAFASYNPKDNQLYYLNRAAKTVQQISLAETSANTPKPETLTGPAFDNPSDWLWAPDYGSVLFKAGDTWKLFTFDRLNLVSQETMSWPKDIGSVGWNPGDTSQLMHYNAPSSDNQTLNRTNPIHASSEIVLNFRDSGISNPKVYWVGNGSDVVLKSQEGRLWRMVVYNRVVTPITQSESVADTLPSPDGQTLLVRQADGTLFLIGIDGKNKQALDVTAPLNQVTWSGDSKTLWAVTEKGGTLSITKVDATTREKAAYAVAANETIGTIASTAVNADQTRLVLAGEKGLALIRLEPSTYGSITQK